MEIARKARRLFAVMRPASIDAPPSPVTRQQVQRHSLAFQFFEESRFKLFREKDVPRWTPEARARQAELIQRWKPWSGSTGPRTSVGKAKVARNADKGKGAQRREGLRLRARARYCLRRVDLLECEDRDFAKRLRTGRLDLYWKKHDVGRPPSWLGLSPSASERAAWIAYFTEWKLE